MIRTVSGTRYVTPLREGGSLPAIVEADDDGTYVLKFRGAGQGPKALIAELLAGELGRALGLPVPEIVLIDLDTSLGRSEPDPEIQALIQASGGLNLGVDYLPGALAYDPLVAPPDEALASGVVWFDAYITNPDRTPKNTNMLLWHRRLWLIDHGAALYFHHTWRDYLSSSRGRFPYIRDHVLLHLATDVEQADTVARARLTPELIRDVVELVPAAWLDTGDRFSAPEEYRDAYVAYLLSRRDASAAFVEEILDARAQLV